MNILYGFQAIILDKDIFWNVCRDEGNDSWRGIEGEMKKKKTKSG